MLTDEAEVEARLALVREAKRARGGDGLTPGELDRILPEPPRPAPGGSEGTLATLRELGGEIGGSALADLMRTSRQRTNLRLRELERKGLAAVRISKGGVKLWRATGVGGPTGPGDQCQAPGTEPRATLGFADRRDQAAARS